MTNWFNSPERAGALTAAVSSWQGTPFFANSCAKGGGVSCQFLAAALYREAGFADLHPPEVDMSHAQFSAASLVEPWVDAEPRFEAVPVALSALILGDLIGIRLGRAVHHVGVMVGSGAFVHALETRGVIISPTADATWRSRITRAWRPIE